MAEKKINILHDGGGLFSSVLFYSSPFIAGI